MLEFRSQVILLKNMKHVVSFFNYYIKHRSGLVWDRIFLARIVTAKSFLSTILIRIFRIRFSPEILERIYKSGISKEEKSKLFTEVLYFVTSGNTFKETGYKRTLLLDEAIKIHASKFDNVQIFDVGTSDGMAVLNLIRKLNIPFSFILSDSNPYYFIKDFVLFKIFSDSDRKIMSIKFLFLYFYLGSDIILSNPGRAINTINPALIENGGSSEIIKFNLFVDILEKPVNIIRCSNLLNICYFTVEHIVDGLKNLSRSLKDGGLIFISHNNEMYRDSESYLVFQKKEDEIIFIENKNEHQLLDYFRKYNVLKISIK